MILKVENAPEFERDLQVAFELCSRDLRLDCLWGTLHFRLAKLGRRRTNGHVFNFIGPNNSLMMEINEERCPCPHHQRQSMHEHCMDTFSHEIVHIKQVRTGELCVGQDRFGKMDSVVWKGRKYGADYIKQAMSDPTSYQNLPWEEEAFRRQKDFFPKIMNQLKANSKASKVYA